MKQKSTIEKHKYLENKKSKNETMFNFKISCLMKKQVINLMMTLAIVFGLSVSAMAQNDAATNASDSRYIMITGSTHTFSVTRSEQNSTINWSLGEENEQSYSGTTSLANDNQDFTVTWDQNASGNYYIQVYEERDGVTCANTTRRFYVNILDFDVLVYVSDASGNELTGTDLQNCGDGTTANYGNDPSGTAFNNIFNTDGELDNITGTAALDLNDETTPAYTQRYISLAVVWEGDAATNAPSYDHITFNYEATVNHGLLQVNGEAPTATTMDGTSGALSGSPTADAAGAYNGGAGSVVTTNAQLTVPGDDPAGIDGETQDYQVYTIPLHFADRWLGTYADITSQFRAQNVTLISTNSNVMGVEPVIKQAASGTEPLMNTSATQTIQLAPATSTITVGGLD